MVENDHLSLNLGSHTLTLQLPNTSFIVAQNSGQTANLTISNGSLQDLTGTVLVSNGTINVTGANTALSFQEYDIAGDGTGAITISQGATVTAQTIKFAQFTDGVGTLTVTNTGKLNVGGSSGLILVGERGHGSVNVTNAGQITAISISASGNPDKTVGKVRADITVDGTSSSLTLLHQLQLGIGAPAFLTVSNHATLSTGGFGGLIVGAGTGGSGNVTIESAGVVTSDGGSVGATSGSQGNVTITGAGSAWNLTSDGSLVVGDAGATGTIAVNAGGLLNAALDSSIGNAAGSNGQISVTDAGSIGSFGGSLNIGSLGTGTLTVANSGNVSIANTLTIGGTTSADGHGIGSLNITGGILSTNALIIGDGASTASTSSGNVTLTSGGKLTVTSDSVIGKVVGSTGSISFSDPGSTATFGSNLNIGYLGTGTLTVANSALVAVTNTLTIGGTNNADGHGNGTLNITSGGQVTANTLDVADGDTTASSSNGTVLVTGANSVLRIETLNLDTTNSTGVASLHVTNSATLTDSDGEGFVFAGAAFGPNTTGSTSITIDNGATVALGLGFALYPQGHQSASLTIDGPTTVVNAPIDCEPLGGGTETVTIRNGAHVNGGQFGFDLDGDSQPASTNPMTITDTMAIEDSGTVVTSPSTLLLSTGLLTVSNGAKLTTGSLGSTSGSTADIGWDNGGGNVFAKAIISGSASWISMGHLVVGFGIPAGITGDTAANGELDITTGGSMQAVNAYVGRFSQAQGTISITDPGSSLTLSGSMYVGGNESPATGSSGTVTLANSGALTIASSLTVWPGSTLDVRGGQALIGSGAFPANGTLRVGPGGTLSGGGTILGNVLNAGGTVAPTHGPETLSIQGGYSQSAGTLAIELAGAGTSQFDKLAITGPTTLAGSLSLSLINSYTPHLGDAYNFLTSTGPLTGHFSSLSTNATLPLGQTFALTYASNSATATLVRVGDSNFDGFVDINDLTAVANHWQQSVTSWSQGDFDNSGFVDIQDLTAVANNWQAGATSGGGSSESFADALAQIGGLTHAAPAPEPSSLTLLTFSTLLLINRRRRLSK